ncbi:MAG: 3,4-dehydroadipyl-CoA semialdehyde dehydrogenase, partial [Planctomycetes bacterium]|nr:3,4-dehydroadipyl-CoA semialdehyde dehydrogenase [Planctomycetota bacterium]
MKTLRNFAGGRWQDATGGFATLYNPATEEAIARASSEGVDFAAALDFARTRGQSALGELTLAERGKLLQAMSKAIFDRRDELLDLSMTATGATRKDAKFDIDGATGTLAYYAALGESLGNTRYIVEGEGVQLGRTAKFWGQHARVPLAGVAVHINAFNFPAWGFAEKAAAALLAGMPVVLKPATSTAWVAERCVEILVAAAILPEGALTLVCGKIGDLIDRLEAHDVVAFTGSADTALAVRSNGRLLAANVRVNVEADSLNAAVVGPDCEPGSETWNLFLKDAEREITQKSGQKCTALRRVFVPRSRLAEATDELAVRLAAAKVGNPADQSVTVGPLATAEQLKAATAGIKLLRGAARLVHGTGERTDGIGAPVGKGYYVAPCLLRADEDGGAAVLHEREVFGPVATLIPYDGDARKGAELIARGGGSLVSSIYSDDEEFVGAVVARGGAHTGRFYLGSEKMAEQAPGSGVALPQCLHGGPGRAGGGTELGGLRALDLYTQCVALQGSRPA